MKSLQILALSAILSTPLVVQAAPATPTPEVQQLLTDAQTAYLKGDIETAKANFEMVYKIDSRNQTAIGFLRRIRAEEATKPKGVSLEKQLSTLIIPQINFKDATLGAAIDYMKKAVQKESGGKQSVNIVLQIPAEQANAQTVTLNLTNVPFTEALKYLGGLVNLDFVYDKFAIIGKPASGATAPAPTASQ